MDLNETKKPGLVSFRVGCSGGGGAGNVVNTVNDISGTISGEKCTVYAT